MWEMEAIFQATNNTRYLPDGSGRYIRSDVPLFVEEAERGWLLDHDIRTVIDLRTERESRRRRCPLWEDQRFACQNLTVTGGNRVPATPAGVVESYLAMADAQMERILDTILQADGGVLYFCTAGKDRTGVVSALLLRRMGVADEVIIGDYLRSAACLAGMLEGYLESHPETDPRVVTPQREYMEAFLRGTGGIMR